MWFVFGCSGRPVQSKSAPNESSSPVSGFENVGSTLPDRGGEVTENREDDDGESEGDRTSPLVRSAGHSYYGTNMSIMADIYHVLHFPRPVNDSGWLERRSRDGQTYWEFATHGAAVDALGVSMGR